MKTSQKKRQYLKEYRATHAEQIKEIRKRYNEKHATQVKERKKDWYETNREKIKQHRKEYRDNNRDKIKSQNRENYEKNREKRLQYNKRHRFNLRMDVLIHYGGSPPKCACCGENRIEFLAVDHENGDGAEHRKTLGSDSIYQWIRKNNYPAGFRVLCHNCNMSFGLYGYCPHQRE